MQTPTPSGAAPDSGAPSASEARTLKGAGLRYGTDDGVPQWAVGKTADEVLAIASQAVGAMSSYTPQAQPSATYAPSPQNAQPGQIAAPDPELAYSNPSEWARQAQAYNEQMMTQRLQAASAPIAQQLAETARELSRSGQYRSVWERWEPEIEIKLAGIPLASRNKALYDQAAQLVRADHIEELARERAEKIAQNAGAGTERAGAMAGAEPRISDDPLTKAFESGHPFFQQAKANGTTPDAIRRFCEQTGTSVEDYIANATRGNVVTSPTGFVRAHV